MSKLPERPIVKENIDKFGINKDYGLWAIASDKLRSFADPAGIHLHPSDFSDLELPSILFIDEKGYQHELSLNSSYELLIDNKPAIDLSSYYTKKQVDKLIEDTSVVVSPNGTKYHISVTDDGEVVATKEA